MASPGSPSQLLSPPSKHTVPATPGFQQGSPTKSSLGTASKITSTVKVPLSTLKSPRPAPSEGPKSPSTVSHSQREVQQLSSVPLPLEEDNQQDPSAAFVSSDDEPSFAPVSGLDSRKVQRGGSGAWVLPSAAILVIVSVAAAAVLCSSPPLIHGLPQHVTDAVAPSCAKGMEIWALTKQHLQRLDSTIDSHLPPNIVQQKAQTLQLLSSYLSQAQDAARQQLVQIKAQVDAMLNKTAATTNTATPAEPVQEQPKAAAAATSFQNIISKEQFRSIISPDEAWAEHVDDFWHAAAPLALHKQKPAAVLLACSAAEGCDAAVQSLLASAGNCGELVPGSSYAASNPDAAGQLQQTLLGVITRCPGQAVLAVSNAELFSIGSVAVLNNALSEAGHLQQDGSAVSTAGTLFVFPVLSSVAADDASFDSRVKDQLLSALEQATEQGEEQGTAVLRAFRRRVDFVAPTHA